MSWNKDGCVRLGQRGFLPPILSGRLHSVASLKYGILEIRAKIPLGDWLWPALWLRPRNSPYKGGWPRGGEIDLMESRGNKGSWDVGMVRSAVHWGTSGRDRKTTAGRKQGGSWHDQFHIYKLEWTTDHIATYVDSQRIMYLEAGTSMYDRGHFSGPNIWASGGKMAPFDQEFYFILNVAVGGTGGTFPDSRRTWTKPWRNNSPNPAKDFWDGRNDWLPTWKGDEVAMIVDWVQFRNL
ncbi:beta-1,3-glucan-binding protein 1 [Plakobranchus ocellatus]|uniref:Beta-1,3-glucan-binding protein 1 n=1 Tax=Plakobranchus ocellatus TaxID=259542 RepID=A0AAV3Z2H9_9GAST|nr:beta-1,3-glucan-binding protein 1 [Plakobranchus ocellatus]